VTVAAKGLGRPVKWRANRAESFLTDTQGGDRIVDGILALDRGAASSRRASRR